MKSGKLLLCGLSLLAALGLGQTEASQVGYDIQKIGTKRVYFVELEGEYPSDKALFEARLGRLTQGDYSIQREYSHAFNGVAVSFNSNLLASVGALPGVANVFGNTVYSRPEGDIELGSPVSGNTDIDSHSAKTLGIAKSDSDYEGKGTTIGILDTGLFPSQIATSPSDASSKAFRPLKASDKPHFASENDPALTAAKTSDGFTGTDAMYIDSKIPFAYDYASEDNNVKPIYVNDHGTHVASLAAANGAHYQGIAPKAQLAIMKVFDDNGSASTSTLLSALEDAAVLKLDVVNLSLGQALIQYEGLTGKGSAETEALANLKKEGTIVNFAAGNDSRGNFNANSGFYADRTTTETVETSEMGSWALQTEANVVASATLDDVNADVLKVDQTQEVTYKDMNDAAVLASAIGAGWDYVRVPDWGEEKDYANLAVSGKLAVVERGGGVTFAEKISQAVAHQAAGVAIVNSDDTLINFAVPSGTAVPVIQLTKSDGASFGDKGTVAWESKVEENGNARHVSSFSSDGPTTDLSMNPDIAAPGDGILGAVMTGYEEMSGTSMATPNLSGAMAYALSAAPDDPDADTLTFNKAKADLMAKLQSTASPIHDDSEKQPEDLANLASPRRQGAGLANVQAAIDAKAYAEVDDSGKAKLEFKNDPAFSKGTISPKITIHNETDKDLQYKATVSVLVPEAVKGVAEGTSQSVIDRLPDGYQDTLLQTTDDHWVGTYEVPGTFSAIHDGDSVVQFSFDATKAFVSKDGTSLLEDYVNTAYPYGTYLEGYVTLTPIEGDQSEEVPELSVPYLGFYGDYGSAPAYEAFDFQREPGVTYNSDIQGSIIRNLANGYPQADYASALYATALDSDYGQILVSAPYRIVYDHTEDPDGLTWEKESSGQDLAGQKQLTHLGFDAQGNRIAPTAGVPGQSDLLAIKQFMNRSAIYGSASLVDPNGRVQQSTYLASFPYNGTGNPLNDITNEAIGNGYPGYPLMKSFATTSLISALPNNHVGLPMTVGALPLRTSSGDTLPAGHYTVRFDYLLQATDGNGNHYQQTKSVPLDIVTTSKVGYRGLVREGSAFRLYVTADTKYVYNAISGTKYVSVAEGEGAYVEIPLDDATQSGYLAVILSSETGVTDFALIDTLSPNGNAVLGPGAFKLANALNGGPFIRFVSKVKDKEGKVADFSLSVLDWQHGDNTSTYTLEGTGWVLGIGAGKSIAKVQILDGKTYRDLPDSASYAYDPSTGLLTVTNLPEGVSTIRVILD